MDEPIESRVRAAYAALNRRDFDEFQTFFHPDAVARSLIMESEAGEYRGRAGMLQLFQDLMEVFPDWRAEVQAVDELRGGAIVEIEVTATSRESGIPMGYNGFIAVGHDTGLVTRAIFVRTEEEARAALRGETD